MLAITQSGETVDTLAAMEEARNKGAQLWSIVNVIGSQADAHVAMAYILMHAGPEIGVASTKAFTASLVDLYLLGCYLGELRGSAGRRRAAGSGWTIWPRCPTWSGAVLDSTDDEYERAGEPLPRPRAFPVPGPGHQLSRSRWRGRSS